VIPAGIEPAAYGLGNHHEDLHDAHPRASSTVDTAVDLHRRASSRIVAIAGVDVDPISSDAVLASLLSAQAHWLGSHDRPELRRRLLEILDRLG
jgi:hypothetical protein